jgi:energy-coupling factor transport system substrate-specific component
MKKFGVKHLTIIALAVAINIVGAKISLIAHLPLFCDSIGTMCAGYVLGPVGGLLTALVGSLINGVSGDVYSFYFAPSGMLMGLLAGWVLHNKKITKPSLIWRTACITVPASAVSAFIETVLFGGITSATFTTAVVQALSKTVMSLFGSAFLTQAITDYIDKGLAIILVMVVIHRLPSSMTHIDEN